MKILYVHQHFKTPREAGGTRSYELSQRLIARGHSVTMICGKTSSFRVSVSTHKGIRRECIDGIDVVQLDVPYSNCDSLIKQSWNFMRFAFKAAWWALREDYDLLFATSTPLTAGIPGIIMKLFRRKKKFVFEVRDLWPEIPRAMGLKNPLVLWGMSFLEWTSYHLADACIGLSPGMREGIAKRSQKGKKIAMIPNACDLDVFTPEKRAKLKMEGITSTDMVAVYAGSHDLTNGLEALLDAAAELKRRDYHNIVLTLVGDGQVKPQLVARAKKENLSNCHFLDPMPKMELSRFLASTDLGLMLFANVPSFYHGTSPNKFFDYIASGLPVLINYPGWLADIIRRDKCGIAVQPDDPVTFADALIELAEHPERRKTMAINSRKLAEREFSRDLLGKRFVDFLEEVARP